MSEGEEKNRVSVRDYESGRDEISSRHNLSYLKRKNEASFVTRMYTMAFLLFTFVFCNNFLIME